MTSEWPPPESPPQSVTNAECAVLAVGLQFPSELTRIVATLGAADFRSTNTRHVFEAISVLHARGEQGMVALSRELGPTKAGAIELAERLRIADVTSAALDTYMAGVREDSRRSQVEQALAELQRDLSARRVSVDDAAADLIKLARHVSEHALTKPEAFTMEEAIAEAEEFCIRQASGEGGGVRTGFQELDDRTGGLRPGELTVIAGAASMGKTTLGLNVARNSAEGGHRVLFVSSEMARRDVALNAMASAGGFDASPLRKGDADKDGWASFRAAKERCSPLPLLFVDRPRSVSRIRALATRHHAQEPLGLIVIDYLQLLRPDKSGPNRNIEVGTMARETKQLAIDLEVPIILLSQLSRKVEDRNDHRPFLSDLRDSGEVEQAADSVIFVVRPDYYQPDESQHTHRANIHIAKARNGRPGTFEMDFHGPSFSFFDVTDDWGPSAHTET